MRPPVEATPAASPSSVTVLPPTVEKQRLLSLDVFRGATIAAMILVNNPGSDAIYPPLRHAVWHGWTPTDMIFPFFLWIVGVAITLSLPRRLARGDSKGTLIRHAAVRAAIIFGIGLLLAGFPYYNLATIRVPGVLQRIAICSFLASVIYLYTSVRGRILWIVFLLAGYWGLMMLVPVPGLGSGFLDREANFARYVDGLFLSGHMYSATKTWDPEGIVSTLPSIATALFGVLMGDLLRSRLSRTEQTVWAVLGGNAQIVAALMMNPWMAINKSIWTTSFSVFMAGMAMVAFAAMYWLIDVKGHRRFTKPFAIYGMNAIVVYILSGLIARLLGLLKTGAGASWKTVVFQNVFAPLASPVNASLLYAIANVLLLYAVAWFLYRRKWFVRF
jgi:predicted acyltransferase